MGKFSNFISNPEPQSTLFREEIDAIAAVVDQVITTLGNRPETGSFILDGQKYGEDAKCILRFNLEQGIFRRQFFRIYEHTSDEMAAESIDNILSWPEQSRYTYRGEAKYFGQLPSDIYRDGELQVLVLNAAYGRFLASFYGDWQPDNRDPNYVVLIMLAEAVAQMMKEDKVIQRSVEEIIRRHATSFDREMIQRVQQWFSACSIPALKAWKDWHEPANSAGELTLCFE